MRAARIDANQQEIVDLFRQLGCSVHITSNVHGGFPDIVVGVAGTNLLVEIKDGNKPPSKQKLTTDEARFHNEWRGRAVVVCCAEDVINLVQNVRRGAA